MGSGAGEPVLNMSQCSSCCCSSCAPASAPSGGTEGMLGMTIPMGLLGGGSGRGLLVQLNPLHCLIQTSVYVQAPVVENTDIPVEIQKQLLHHPFEMWRNGKLKEKSRRNNYKEDKCLIVIAFHGTLSIPDIKREQHSRKVEYCGHVVLQNFPGVWYHLKELSFEIQST